MNSAVRFSLLVIAMVALGFGAYLLGAWLLTVWIADGGPGWLNLVVLIAIWSAFKMLWIGPVSLVLLARVRIHEHTERRQRRQAQGVSSAPIMAGGAS